MTTDLRVISEPSAAGLRWRALDGEVVIGQVAEWLRPDNRLFLHIGSCREDAFQPMLSTITRDLSGDLYVTVDEQDEFRRAELARFGFNAIRQESTYEISVDSAWATLKEVALPKGIALQSADDVSEDRLRELDEDLRQDVPGTDGWRWDPADFQEETFDNPAFDPDLYWVASAADDEYVGLTRVWNNQSGPRLGFVGVRAAFRRRRLAKALLGRVFRVLHERGTDAVSADVDDSNVASRSLFTGLGARRTGGSFELVRLEGHSAA